MNPSDGKVKGRGIMGDGSKGGAFQFDLHKQELGEAYNVNSRRTMHPAWKARFKGVFGGEIDYGATDNGLCICTAGREGEEEMVENVGWRSVRDSYQEGHRVRRSPVLQLRSREWRCGQCAALEVQQPDSPALAGNLLICNLALHPEHYCIFEQLYQ